ncbi:acyl carrier protein [Micromonospora echinospora]|uniref:acyl carrier protein n=1 Tax=Micromonospora echinospora TaxID=1877 RepID=UPI003CF8BC3D
MSSPSRSAASGDATGLATQVTVRVAALLDVPAERIRPDVPLAEQGLDSVSAVGLVADLEDQLGVALDPQLTWDHPTVDEIVRFLSGRLDAPRAVTAHLRSGQSEESAG